MTWPPHMLSMIESPPRPRDIGAFRFSAGLMFSLGMLPSSASCWLGEAGQSPPCAPVVFEQRTLLFLNRVLGFRSVFLRVIREYREITTLSPPWKRPLCRSTGPRYQSAAPLALRRHERKATRTTHMGSKLGVALEGLGLRPAFRRAARDLGPRVAVSELPRSCGVSQCVGVRARALCAGT